MDEMGRGGGKCSDIVVMIVKPPDPAPFLLPFLRPNLALRSRTGSVGMKRVAHLFHILAELATRP